MDVSGDRAALAERIGRSSAALQRNSGLVLVHGKQTGVSATGTESRAEVSHPETPEESVYDVLCRFQDLSLGGDHPTAMTADDDASNECEGSNGGGSERGENGGEVGASSTAPKVKGKGGLPSTVVVNKSGVFSLG